MHNIGQCLIHLGEVINHQQEDINRLKQLVLQNEGQKQIKPQLQVVQEYDEAGIHLVPDINDESISHIADKMKSLEEFIHKQIQI